MYGGGGAFPARTLTAAPGSLAAEETLTCPIDRCLSSGQTLLSRDGHTKNCIEICYPNSHSTEHGPGNPKVSIQVVTYIPSNEMGFHNMCKTLRNRRSEFYIKKVYCTKYQKDSLLRTHFPIKVTVAAVSTRLTEAVVTNIHSCIGLDS